MKKLVFIFVSTLLFASCSNDNELKKKELELKERELQVRENELIQKTKEVSKGENSQPIPKKRLRYLYSGNAGLKAFYNDGSVSFCSHCDLCTENVRAVFTDKKIGTYKVLKDGSLLCNNGDGDYTENPVYGFSYEGWAMIDYQWQVEVKPFDEMIKQ